MARYTGPAWKVSRRLGFSTLETGREIAKRNYAPGKPKPDRKKKQTEYGRQLAEKQKVRVMYGVNERQFRRLFVIAKNSTGVTGDEFSAILEARLDNVVYRMGLARTRRGARQLVNHGHILVDGKKVDIPSYLVDVGSKVAVKETSKNLKVIKDALTVAPTLAPFVSFDQEKMEGVYIRRPEKSELNQEIDVALIVEYYNRLV